MPTCGRSFKSHDSWIAAIYIASQSIFGYVCRGVRCGMRRITQNLSATIRCRRYYGCTSTTFVRRRLLLVRASGAPSFS